jgi:hypothetical protein
VPVVERDIDITAKKVLEDGLNQAKGRPVHVVDGRNEEQKGTNDPAKARFARLVWQRYSSVCRVCRMRSVPPQKIARSYEG